MSIGQAGEIAGDARVEWQMGDSPAWRPDRRGAWPQRSAALGNRRPIQHHLLPRIPIAPRRSCQGLRRGSAKIFQAPPVEWIEERLAGMQEVLERQTERSSPCLILRIGSPGRQVEDDDASQIVSVSHRGRDAYHAAHAVPDDDRRRRKAGMPRNTHHLVYPELSGVLVAPAPVTMARQIDSDELMVVRELWSDEASPVRVAGAPADEYETRSVALAPVQIMDRTPMHLHRTALASGRDDFAKPEGCFRHVILARH